MQLVKMAMSKGDQGKSHQPHCSAGTADNHSIARPSQSKTSLQIQAENTSCDNDNHVPVMGPPLPDCCEIQDPESLHVNTYTGMGRGGSPSRLPLFVNTSSPVSVVHSASNVETTLSKISSHIITRSSVNSFIPVVSQENESNTTHSESTEDGSMMTSTDEETERECLFDGSSEQDRQLGSDVMLGSTNQPASQSGEGDSGYKDDSNVFDENMNVPGTQDNNLVSGPSSHYQNFLHTQTAPEMSDSTEVSSENNREPCIEEFVHEASSELICSSLQTEKGIPDMKMFESLTRNVLTNTENSHQLYLDTNQTSNQHSHHGSLKLKVIQSPCNVWSSNRSTFSTGSRIEPPIRTSLALKDCLSILPGIVRPLPQHNFTIKSSVSPSPPPYTFKPIEYDSYSEDSNDGSEEQIFSDTGSESDADLPEFRVFQHCNGINRKCVSSDGVNDLIENGINRCDVNEARTTGLNFDRNVNSASVTMEEAEMFLRLLPSLHSCNDFILSHMADEEVAMIMHRNDEENEDEELVAFDMVDGEMGGSAGRPTNPVARILECGGNEHFLPIVSDVFQDSVTPE